MTQARRSLESADATRASTTGLLGMLTLRVFERRQRFIALDHQWRDNCHSSDRPQNRSRRPATTILYSIQDLQLSWKDAARRRSLASNLLRMLSLWPNSG